MTVYGVLRRCTGNDVAGGMLDEPENGIRDDRTVSRINDRQQAGGDREQERG